MWYQGNVIKGFFPVNGEKNFSAKEASEYSWVLGSAFYNTHDKDQSLPTGGMMTVHRYFVDVYLYQMQQNSTI